MAYFDVKTAEEQGQSLINYLPNGRIFAGKNVDGTNIRAYFLALGTEILRAENNLNTLACEFFPQDTTLFIEEWEALVGIPDECFTNTGDIETRRRNVLLKLASLAVVTIGDFENLCDIFEIPCVIHSGISTTSWPWSWPHEWFPNQKTARFTMIVDLPTDFAGAEWPWSWPHPWSNDPNTIQCLFDQLKPGNVVITYRFIL